MVWIKLEEALINSEKVQFVTRAKNYSDEHIISVCFMDSAQDFEYDSQKKRDADYKKIIEKLEAK